MSMIRDPRRTRQIKLQPNQIQRFAERIIKSFDGDCWLWDGLQDPKGYGLFCHFYAHRVAYTLHRGDIPAGMTLDHLCRNKWCVNPSHLEVVSFSENSRRGQIDYRREAKQVAA